MRAARASVGHRERHHFRRWEDAKITLRAFLLIKTEAVPLAGEFGIDQKRHRVPRMRGHERRRRMVATDHQHVRAKVGQLRHERVELLERVTLRLEVPVLTRGIGRLVVHKEIVEVVPSLLDSLNLLRHAPRTR